VTVGDIGACPALATHLHTHTHMHTRAQTGATENITTPHSRVAIKVREAKVR